MLPPEIGSRQSPTYLRDDPPGGSAAPGELPGRRARSFEAGIGTVAGLAVVIAGLGLSACLSRRLPNLFGGNLHMQVFVAEKLNNNSPVAVELLVIYDKGLLKTLEQMTAAQWFQNREQILKDNQSKKKKLDNWKWEWVPGQTVPEQVRPYSLGIQGALIFANYFSAGPHRASCNPVKPFLLSLQTSDFTAERLD